MDRKIIAPSGPHKLVKVALKAIEMDGGTQSRARMSEERIKEYAEAIQRGADLFQNVPDPVTLFHDGSTYRPGDGSHRTSAALRVGLTHILAVVTTGSKDDAIFFAIGANTRHGLPRSIDDKHRAVRLALQHPKSRGWSDRSIAKLADVSHPFVAKVRAGGNVTTQTTQSASRRPVRREKPSVAPQDPLDRKAEGVIRTLNMLYDEGVMSDLADLHPTLLSDERRKDLGEVASRLIDELSPFAIPDIETGNARDGAGETTDDLGVEHL